MEAIILSLLAWLNLHTEYDTNVDLPNVVITEQGNMCAQYGIDNLATCKATQLRGFYDRGMTIYLHAGFDPEDPGDQARLLHELVHYLQWQNGRDDSDCWGRLEVEAYTLQDTWLYMNDLEEQADPFKLVMLEAACDT